jgi:hypothetical protein
MLSFMREQGARDPSPNQTKGTGPQHPKTSEDAGSLEYLTVSTSSKNARQSTIVVAILVAIGLICLLWMIRKSQPQMASAKQGDEEQTKIEAAVSRVTGISSEMVSKMDQILTKFGEFSNVLQVEVNELVKDPFEVEVFAKEQEPSTTASALDAGLQAAAFRRQNIKQRAATLGLLSVMQSGRANSCMINDQLLQKGDMIEGFVITQIGRDFVELVWRGSGESNGGSSAGTEDYKVVLKLSQ